mmetsp:Transcript_15683/g.31770  ORF Transcript_15683/g.31770 Transcript_15683/m.31770 type:complete len:380 (+) Transcript_15683:451-1590(+)
MELVAVDGLVGKLAHEGPDVGVVAELPVPVAVAVAVALPVAVGLVLAVLAAVVAVAVPVARAVAVPVTAAVALVVAAVPAGRRVLLRDLSALGEVHIVAVQHLCEVEGVDAEQGLEGHRVRRLGQGALGDGNEGVHATQRLDGLLQLLGAREVDLVQEDLVCEGHLLRGLVYSALRPLARQLLDEMHRVHYGEHPVDLAVRVHKRIAVERLADRAWVCYARGLDQDAMKGLSAVRVCLLLLLGGLDDALDGLDEVVPDGAAEAAVVQKSDGLLRLLLVARRGQELVVDAHLADLVLDHGVAPPVLRLEDVVEQGGLPSSEEARQHRDGDLPILEEARGLADDAVVVQGREDHLAVVELDLVRRDAAGGPPLLPIPMLGD